MAAGNFSSPASSPASGGSPGRQNGGQGSPEPAAPLSFYALLQLAEDASLEELRQAFRRQSKRLHPDTTSLPAALAQESFRQLRQAYVTLLDPERRRAYDASLAAARARAGQGLRTLPGAPGSAWAGAAPAGGLGMRPPQNGSPASQGGPAPMAHPVGPASSLGNTPGAANREGNGSQGNGGQGTANQVNASQRNGSQGAKGPDVSGLGVDGGLPKPDSVRRTLSGGEWFALLLLGVALVFCLVLGVGLAWLRGTELVREPSWWSSHEPMALPGPGPSALSQTGTSPGVALAHSLLAAGPDAPLQPSAPGD